MSTTPLLTDIAEAVEQIAPPRLQESYDNTGWQVLCDPAARCTGVLTCVDATPDVIEEAHRLGFNLVLSHHPVLFRGQKRFAGETLVQRTVMQAIRSGISVYSCHTAIDSAPGGVSAEMARMIGMTDVRVLAESASDRHTGLGAVGNLSEPLTPGALVELVKRTFATPVARCSRPKHPHEEISRVALCGGSGSEFLPLAAASGAQAYITSDTKHHDFVDFSPELLIIDIGHWEAEACTCTLFSRELTARFPEIQVMESETDRSPVIYM